MNFPRVEVQSDGNYTHHSTCPLCGKASKVENIEASRYERWRDGEHVQDVLPELSAGDREILISGCHSECWDKTFSE